MPKRSTTIAIGAVAALVVVGGAATAIAVSGSGGPGGADAAAGSTVSRPLTSLTCCASTVSNCCRTRRTPSASGPTSFALAAASFGMIRSVGYPSWSAGVCPPCRWTTVGTGSWLW